MALPWTLALWSSALVAISILTMKPIYIALFSAAAVALLVAWKLASEKGLVWRFLEGRSPFQRFTVGSFVAWSLVFWFGGSESAVSSGFDGVLLTRDLRNWVWPVGFVCMAGYFLAGMQNRGRTDD